MTKRLNIDVIESHLSDIVPESNFYEATSLAIQHIRSCKPVVLENPEEGKFTHILGMTGIEKVKIETQYEDLAEWIWQWRPQPISDMGEIGDSSDFLYPVDPKQYNATPFLKAGRRYVSMNPKHVVGLANYPENKTTAFLTNGDAVVLDDSYRDGCIQRVIFDPRIEDRPFSVTNSKQHGNYTTPCVRVGMSTIPCSSIIYVELERYPADLSTRAKLHIQGLDDPVDVHLGNRPTDNVYDQFWYHGSVVSGDLQVFIKMLSGRLLTLMLCGADTVGDVYRFLSRKCEFSEKSLLVAGNRTIRFDVHGSTTVSELGLVRDMTIHQAFELK